MHELEVFLNAELKLENPLDWEMLIEGERFTSSLPRQPYIQYDTHGMPVDIDYREMTEEQPQEPEIPPEPTLDQFTTKFSILDKLLLQEDRRRQRSHDAYVDALDHWKRSNKRLLEYYVDDMQRWNERANGIDAENEQRYQQCIEDQKRWQLEKEQFDERKQQFVASIEKFKQGYENLDGPSVAKYVGEVLSRAKLPAYFPRYLSIHYIPELKALSLKIKLLHPDNLPTDITVPKTVTGDEIKAVPLSASDREVLYANLVRVHMVRTLHAAVASDTADAIKHLVVNGFVDTVDLKTGDDIQPTIASLHATKNNLLTMRLDRDEVAECYDGLAGKGTTESVSQLLGIEPFQFDGVKDDEWFTIDASESHDASGS
ncbi:MAG: hypothetical protein AB8B63_14840 [Granulosicoccus sp.]